MFIRDLYIKKEKVILAKETETIEEVLNKIKESGYRCIPVIDENQNYVGMIYKIHLKEKLYEENGKKEDGIKELIKHKGIFVDENDSFFKTLQKVITIPFISVVNDGKFLGIMTHGKVLGVLEDSLGLNSGGITFTVTSPETKGAIQKLGNILKNENIAGFLTLDSSSKLVRRIVITLEENKNKEEIEQIEKKLNKSGFKILYID
jgi:CBS domain-containing protein